MSQILVGPLAVAGVSTILAFIIALLDKLLNNYGDLDVSINGGKKKLTVKGGSPLLGTLAAEGIFVPSACGGRGSCGACKCKVLTDVGPHLPTELPYLLPKEIEENIRLACQIKVRQNLEIELPEELFSIKKFKAKVEILKDLTYDIKELYLALEDQEIEFQAGQYVQLVVPAYGDIPESTQRAYSMSSRPSDKKHVELLIRLVPGGIATTWVHKHLKQGDTVEVVGPFGEFHIHDTPATMICVAGGSGMAPLKSMINHMHETGEFPEKEIWYFFGARTQKDMFYLDEMAKLAASWPRFHFIPALSEQPTPEENWQGEVGLITDVLDRYLQGKIDKAKGFEGYLCGSPGMINACINVMRKNAMPEEKIYFDKFA
ncbi:MAG: 2Fe-2S iron-sulfur cluster binding domain-containing protein [Spirochaetia bacterium]|jgi:Na+-transporting NADH:ubiquinone oxidoreductase subunit F|nr:2Fe-2S iron-sulfur cluster binding domain-containing protein [Spirochaetia bacterium]